MSETPQTPSTPVERKVVGVLAEFETTDQLLAAARAIRGAGFRKWDAHTPYPVHGLDRAMGLRPTILPWLVFGAGITGLVAAIGLQWFTNAFNYPLNISGKPIFSLQANIPVAFELTVLLSGITAFAGVLALGLMPQYSHPLLTNRRFRRATSDRFFISIEADSADFDFAKATAFLQGLDASAVEMLEEDAAPARLPRWLILSTAVLVALSLVPLMLIAARRAGTREDPPPRIFTEMVNQPKYITQDLSPFFEDHRTTRPPVTGSVARGELQEDDVVFRGKTGEQFVARIPIPVSQALMERGQKRFNIYCATCHGLAGNGDGMIAKRADELAEGTWVPPTGLNTEPVAKQLDGQLFNTITHGIRKMPAYGPMIPVDDRWAIVFYVRALQRSQRAKVTDVPAEKRPALR
jgi:mono/diheme cytochrome c family protein